MEKATGLLCPRNQANIHILFDHRCIDTRVHTSVVMDAGLLRGAKSCRLRWKNYLRPNIKRGMMSEDEKDLIIRLHKLLGNR